MNYYIIPKNNFNIKIDLLINPNKINPFISYSLIHFLNDIYSQLLNINIEAEKETEIEIKKGSTNDTILEFINKIVNPFEFIHTNVPGSFLSVSKVKPSSNIFFELMEVFQVCNIIELLSLKNQIHISHITKNNTSTTYLMDMLRENNNDIITTHNFEFDSLCEKFITNIDSINKSDVFLFEFDESDYINTDTYIKNMILVLYIVIKYQASNGICIIKMDNIFYKTIVDILFIFSAIYERVLIIKPSISKITKGERYLICKNLNMDILNNTRLFLQLDEIIKPMIINKLFNNTNIHSLIKNDIPYYFSNKIEESNAVIGQQQLEAYDQILNILKSKNKNDKIEILKRNHIQKCIQWCEKNQLPHNKFIDKLNIFLNVKQKEFNEKIVQFDSDSNSNSDSDSNSDSNSNSNNNSNNSNNNSNNSNNNDSNNDNNNNSNSDIVNIVNTIVNNVVNTIVNTIVNELDSSILFEK